jgi:F-type H+-transporting ATPase subunit epsilon
MMQLDILTPEKKLFSGVVDSVTLPGTMGLFTLLPNHAPMISSLRRNGEISYVCGNNRNTVVIGGGFVEVNSNQVTVCAEQQISNL